MRIPISTTHRATNHTVSTCQVHRSSYRLSCGACQVARLATPPLATLPPSTEHPHTVPVPLRTYCLMIASLITSAAAVAVLAYLVLYPYAY